MSLGQKSVFYRGTGKMVNRYEAKSIKFPCIVRNNEVFEPEFLEPYDLQGRSIFLRGDRQNGLDMRLNATGDIADNATGYQISIDTITYIVKMISEQKFYQFSPAELLPLTVGEGAYSSQLLYNRTYSVSENFESGNLEQGTSNARLTTAETAIDGVVQPTQYWAKTVQYSVIEVEQALRANSWDPIMLKHEARKRNWDLGIQATATWGLASDSRFPGLFTNTAFNTNTSVIQKYISSMSATELQTFLGAFIQAYFSNTNSTAMPNTLIMPQQDYMGCAQVLTPNVVGGGTGTYPIPLLKYLEDAFRLAVQPFESSFRIIGNAYADAAVNNAARGLNKNYYILTRNDPRSLRMNIPVDYTVTQANSINNFQFQDTAYGQYTGVVSLRNLETLVFTF